MICDVYTKQPMYSTEVQGDIHLNHFKGLDVFNSWMDYDIEMTSIQKADSTTAFPRYCNIHWD